MASPVLHTLLPAPALLFPPLGRAVHPLGCARAPLVDVTTRPMPSASHPSAPYQVSQDRQPNGPEHDEADHHQRDPSGSAEVVYACHYIRHGRFTSGVACLMSMFITFTWQRAQHSSRGDAGGPQDFEACRPQKGNEGVWLRSQHADQHADMKRIWA